MARMACSHLSEYRGSEESPFPGVERSNVMQAVMVVPSGSEKILMQRVAGVPLLVRIVATAKRAGVSDLVLFWPDDLDPAIWQQCASYPTLRGIKILRMQGFRFDPRKTASWSAVFTVLEEEFLWLPWHFVTSSRIVAAIELSPVLPLSWDNPVRLSKELISCSSQADMTSRPAEGVLIQSHGDVTNAERFLVKNSGKPTDGLYS